jgi:uncharacterized membrane protein YfcA
MAAYLFVLLTGFAAGCLSGIIGTGSSIMLLPVLVHAFGPKQAVPIMAVAAVMANLSRVLAWWREVDWKAVGVYAITGVPAAALGARTLLALPANVIEISLGIFFLAMIPVRHLLARLQWKARLWHLAIAGAFIGFLTGIVLSTGPLSVPVFLAYGRVRVHSWRRKLPARCSSTSAKSRPSASSVPCRPMCCCKAWSSARR